MNNVLVRGWEIEHYRTKGAAPDRLFITYPEDNSGHDLITCLNCGRIYAITIAKEVYIGPERSQRLKALRCLTCGEPLDKNSAPYPETYVINGQRFHVQRDSSMPDDASSVVKEFPGIYE